MKSAMLAMCLLMLTVGARSAPSIQDLWRASLDQDNRDWAKTAHAILKIQDAAYLGEGQSATLVGIKGKPNSYKWQAGNHAGILHAEYRSGNLSITKDGKIVGTMQTSIAVDSNVDVEGYATQISAGVMGARVLVYNQLRAEALNFKGVDYYPYNETYRVSVRFTPDLKLPPRVFRTSRGTDKQFFHAGDAVFSLNGKTFHLPFYADSNDPKKIRDMTAFFVDDLTGKTTYGAGRYVDMANFGAFPPASATVDFNDAYNPNCARSAFFTCPVATDYLATVVEAGERDPHVRH